MKTYKVPLLLIRKEKNNCYYHLIDDIYVKKNLTGVQEIVTGYKNFYWLQEDALPILRNYSINDFEEAIDGDYFMLLGNYAEKVTTDMIDDYIDFFQESSWVEFYKDVESQEKEQEEKNKENPVLHKSLKR